MATSVFFSSWTLRPRTSLFRPRSELLLFMLFLKQQRCGLGPPWVLGQWRVPVDLKRALGHRERGPANLAGQRPSQSSALENRHSARRTDRLVLRHYAL